MHITALVLAALATAASASNTANTASPPPRTSIYTSLAAAQCRTLEVHEIGSSSVQRCAGVAGYHLLVLDDDSRMSITVVDPRGKEHPLDLWTLVSTSFSSLGPVAEWRVEGRSKTPFALIVRFNASDPETAAVTSSLAVVKITPDSACLVDVIPPGPRANEKARDSADAATTRSCRSDE
jgi:hypothetical protein